jgi:broad specificity phosphatase PhoE
MSTVPQAVAAATGIGLSLFATYKYLYHYNLASNGENKASASSVPSVQLIPRNSCYNLLLIRHAESTNNVLAEEMQTKYAMNVYSLHAATELMQEYERNRSSDPGLSSLGHKQAQFLLQHPYLQELRLLHLVAANRVEMICSPLRRTIETSLPLLIEAQKLRNQHNNAFRAQLLADICERGGCYRTEFDDAGKQINIRLLGSTRAQLNQQYGSTHNAEKIKEQGWWQQTEQGEEKMHEFHDRVNRAIEFIKQQALNYCLFHNNYKNNSSSNNKSNSPTNSTNLPPDFEVLFTHADFIDGFLVRLLQLPNVPQYIFYSANTSVTHIEFELPPVPQKDGVYSTQDLQVRIRCSNSKPINVGAVDAPPDE